MTRENEELLEYLKTVRREPTEETHKEEIEEYIKLLKEAGFDEELAKYWIIKQYGWCMHEPIDIDFALAIGHQEGLTMKEKFDIILEYYFKVQR